MHRRDRDNAVFRTDGIFPNCDREGVNPALPLRTAWVWLGWHRAASSALGIKVGPPHCSSGTGLSFLFAAVTASSAAYGSQPMLQFTNHLLNKSGPSHREEDAPPAGVLCPSHGPSPAGQSSKRRPFRTTIAWRGAPFADACPISYDVRTTPPHTLILAQRTHAVNAQVVPRISSLVAPETEFARTRIDFAGSTS